MPGERLSPAWAAIEKRLRFRGREPFSGSRCPRRAPPTLIRGVSGAARVPRVTSEPGKNLWIRGENSYGPARLHNSRINAAARRYFYVSAAASSPRARSEIWILFGPRCFRTSRATLADLSCICTDRRVFLSGVGVAILEKQRTLDVYSEF